jgi:hypothetical protein
LKFGNFYGDVGWRGGRGRGIVASRRQNAPKEWSCRSNKGMLFLTWGNPLPHHAQFVELDARNLGPSVVPRY